MTELVEEKKCYDRWLTTKESDDRKQYVRLRQQEVKQVVSKAKGEVWENKCQEIDHF